MTFVSNSDSTNGPLHNSAGNQGAIANITGSGPDPFGAHTHPQQIAFIDQAIADIDTLIQGLENSKIVLIDTAENGITKITETLSHYQNLDSVQIFSHGNDAQLQLGNNQLSTDTLNQNTSELTQWGQSLSEKGDILLFGCNVTASQTGKAFIHDISEITGADVAASENLTGQDGDWVLESVVGSVESDNGVSAIAQSRYAGTLSLLNNGSFESGITGWTKFNGSESVATGGALAGKKLLSLNKTNDGVGQIISAAAQQTYQLKSHAKSSSSGYSAMGITFFDKNYKTLSNTAGDAIASNNWKAYEVEATAPNGTAFAQVWAYRGGNTGKVLIDKVELTTPQFSGESTNDGAGNGSGQNDSVGSNGSNAPTKPNTKSTKNGDELLKNGGFESGLSNWRTFKGQEKASNTDSFSGSRALQLTTADSGTEQIIASQPGKTYQLSGRAKSSGNHYSGFGLHFLDANYSVIRSIGGKSINTKQWGKYEAQGTAPDGTAFVQVWTYKGGNDGSTFIDGISLTAEGAQTNTQTNTQTSTPPVETLPTPPTETPQRPPTNNPPNPNNPPTPNPPTSKGAQPVITSNGGGPTADIFLDEGTAAVTQVQAKGSNLSYAISGGADAGDFKINRTTGQLSFKAKPDYEAPVDANRDNVYDVTVSVANGSQQQDQQTLSVGVNNKVSVFLLGGQSNMVGQGENRDLSGNLAQAYSDVQIWDSQNFSNLRPGFSGPTGTWGEFGPELTFGRGINGHTDEEVYLIKHATGATTLANDWDPNGSNNQQYDLFVNRVSNALKHLDGENISYDIEGMLWMQGESDTYPGADTSYGENLTEFIADMRGRYNPNMKFVIGKIHGAFGETVRTEQESVAKADPRTYIVSTDRFGLRSDGVHYNTAGQIDLGYAFANAIKNS